MGKTFWKKFGKNFGGPMTSNEGLVEFESLPEQEEGDRGVRPTRERVTDSKKGSLKLKYICTDGMDNAHIFIFSFVMNNMYSMIPIVLSV